MARRRLVIARRGLGDLTQAGVSNQHVPGEEWTMGAGQGCASGFVEQELANGNWTCIPMSSFQQIQQGNYTSLSPLPVADVYRNPSPTLTLPSGQTVQTQAATTMPAVQPPPPPVTATSPTTPAPTPATPVTTDVAVTPSGSVGLQFSASNPDSAMPPVQSPTGSAAATTDTGSSGGMPWLLLAGAASLFILFRSKRHA